MSYPKITEMIDFREHFRGEFQATESNYLRSTQIYIYYFIFSPSLGPAVLYAYVRACTNAALSPYVVCPQFAVFIH